MGLITAGGKVSADDQAAPAPAEDKPTASVSVDFLSQYLWRGYALSAHSAVIQPSITAGYKGFSVNIWGNLDTDQNLFQNGAKWNETDLTASYTRELFKNFSGTVGTIYYSLENATYDSWEVFTGVSYNFPWFTLGLTSYREVSHNPGWWVQLDVGKNIPLPWCGMNLALGASLGYEILDDSSTVLDKAGRTGSYSAFHAATLSTALQIPVCKYVTIAPKIGVALPMSNAASANIEANSWDGDDTHVFGGLNITASF